MKYLQKITALLLALAMAVALFLPGLPLHAGAAEEAPVATVSDICVNPLYADILTEDDLDLSQTPAVFLSEPTYLTSVEEAGMFIREGIKSRAETITVYFQTPEFDDNFTEEVFKAQIREMMDYAMAHTGVPDEGDYLLWQYGGWGYDQATAYSREDNGKTVYQWTIPINITYYTTIDQEEQVDAAVEQLLKSWDLSGAPDYLKIRTIYDYICSHVTYDHDHVNDSSYTLQYTAYGALQNGTAVCQGYAVLLYRLALELDVDCRLIAGTGNKEAHGWNIVELKDLYYDLDSTWDAGNTEYQYFLKCDDNFGNHVRDEEYRTESFHAAYPMSDADYVPTASDTCKAHTYDAGQVTTEATCIQEGVMTYTCTNCGYTCTETIATTDHDYIAVVTAPTCIETGYTTYTCADCGYSYVDDQTDALGHSWDSGKVTKEPTEKETGIRTYTCTRANCGETKTETIPVLEHTHSYTSVVTAPTCTEKGYTTYTCACGDTYTADEVAALGHKYENGTCAVCGQTDPNYNENVTRISGSDRYATAFAVADQLKEVLGVDAFSTIVVASGTNFPDALAGSYLATEFDAPILLTSEKAASQVQAYIEENLTEGGTVYILGGEAAVSPEFQESLEKADIEVERLSGKDRYATNLAILKEARLNGKKILVCTGENFADSLSASAVNLPILLVNSKTKKLTAEQEKYLETLESCTFYIIGGTGAVSAELADALAAYGTVERISGKDREATTVAVANTFFDSPDTVALAYSRNFPDGLCGGPLAYHLGAPLLLVNSGAESYAAAYVEETGIETGIVLGGTTVISDDTVSAVLGN